MGAGWIAKGPDTASAPAQGDADPWKAQGQDTQEWQPAAPDRAADPASITRPHAKPGASPLDNTRSLFTKGKDFLLGHEPQSPQDQDQAHIAGVLPALGASVDNSVQKVDDWMSSGPSVSTLARSYPKLLGADFGKLKAGYQDLYGASQVQRAERDLAALNVLPQVAARLPGPNDAGKADQMAGDALVQKTARSLGISPEEFAHDYATMAGVSNEDLADRAARAKEVFDQGKSNQVAAKGTRNQAWADERVWQPSDLENGKLDPWSLKGLAFNTALGVPKLAAVTAATVGGTALGGPGGGVAAGAGTAMALFAPAQREEVKDKIDDQVNRLLQKADQLDDAAPVGGKRGLNPVTEQIRQQAQDLASNSEHIANTAGFLYAVGDAAGALPVSSVLARTPTGKAVMDRLVGATLAKTMGGRIAGTMVANGAGGMVQASIQKAVDAGIVHENTTLADALKDIAYTGVISATTAAPIGAAHEIAGAGAARAARRNLDSDELLSRVRSASEAMGRGGDDYPGFKYNQDTGRYEPTTPDSANVSGTSRLPVGDAGGDSASPGAGGGPSPQAPPGAPGQRAAYQAKTDALHEAAAAAEKRSDVTLEPEEEGWSVHVKGQPVATFDSVEVARAAVAQARKLVGTKPASPETNPPSDATEAPISATTAPSRETTPGKPTTFQEVPYAGESPRESQSTPVKTPVTTGGEPGAARVPETPLERTQPVQSERRSAGDLRQRVADMSPEQMKAALLTHDLTGIPNKRAFDEAPKKPAVASLDVDSLGWVNNFGHEAGDQYLKSFAQALHEVGGADAFHKSGDEFILQGDDQAHLEDMIGRVRDRLAGAQLTFEHPDGRVLTLKGINFSHGAGDTYEQADSHLDAVKREREAQGLRAPKGSEPRGASLQTPEGGVSPHQGGAPAGGTEGLPGSGSAGARPARRSLEVLGQHVEAPHSPSAGQAKAGNYFKPTVQWHGLPIKLENAAGSKRGFKYPDGTAGTRTMRDHYGYFPAHEGADGDGVDVFVAKGAKNDEGHAYVIDQLDGAGKSFDEHKVVLGVGSAEAAKALYLSHYQAGWKGFGGITELDAGQLKRWLKEGDLQRPIDPESVPTAKVVRGVAPDARHDSILQFLARHPRGLDREEAAAQGIDPSDMGLAAAHVGIRRAFRKGGMSFDHAAETLHQEGYPVTDAQWHYSPNVLLDRLDDELRGTKHLSTRNEAHTAVEPKDWRQPLSDRELTRLSIAGAQERLAKLQAEQERLEREIERAGLAEDSDLESSRELDRIPFQRREGATQGDLFGDKVAVQNEIKRLNTALDAKRNSGQESLETGRPDDLFSAAREQLDLGSLKEHESTYEVQDRKRGAGKTARNVRPAAAVSPGQLDIFAKGNSAPSKRAVAQLASKATLARIGSFRTAHKVVDTWQKAAHILAPIRRSPQEVMAALVLDKAGAPLAVIRHSIGVSNGASVEPWSLGGAVAQVPGAAQVYLAHNHPSGEASQSVADHRITTHFLELMRGSGIDMKGHIVIGGGGKQVSFRQTPEESEDFGYAPSAIAGGRTQGQVPSFGRQMRAGAGKSPHFDAALNSPRQARAIIGKIMEEHPSGVLLLDTRHRIKGIVPMSAKEMARLRTGDTSSGAARLLAQLAEANTPAMMPFGEDKAGVKNVMAFGAEAGVRAIDGWVKDSEGDIDSLSERGEEGQGAFFSRGFRPPEGWDDLFKDRAATMSHGDIRAATDKMLAGFSVKPDVVIAKNLAELQADPQIGESLAGAKDEEVVAFMHPATGKIYLVGNQMRGPEEVAATLAHEYITHYGLRAAFGDRRSGEYQKILDGVARALPVEMRKRGEAEFPGSFNPLNAHHRNVAAEETLAYFGQRYAKDQSIPARAKRWLDRLMGMLRDWVRQVLGLPQKFDATFVKRTLGDLESYLRRGPRSGASSDESLAAGTERPAFAGKEDTFFSGLAKAVDGAKREKGTGAEWEATLRNMPGVKPEELAWVGLPEWLKDQGRVTKAQVADFVHGHQVRLNEKILGKMRQQPLSEEQISQVASSAESAMGLPLEREQTDALRAGGADALQVINELRRMGVAIPETEVDRAAREDLAHFEQYRTPGGENYREHLLQLDTPAMRQSAEQQTRLSELYAARERTMSEAMAARRAFMDLVDLPQDVLPGELTHAINGIGRAPGARARLEYIANSQPEYRRDLALEALHTYHNAQVAAREATARSEAAGRAFLAASSGIFTKGHWHDTPNVLAHIRTSEHTDSSGAKVHLIEEIQSDWHQLGRREGYWKANPTQEDAKALFGITDKVWGELNADQRESYRLEAASGERHVRENTVPDAPFKKSWPLLAFKATLRRAIETGADKIAWTTGEQQADRYDLSKQLSRINLHDNITSSESQHPRMEGDFQGGLVEAYDKNDNPALHRQVASADELATLIGKDAAEKILKGAPTEGALAGQRSRMRTLEGLDLKVGGEGMKAFYDRELPNEIGKYVKRWGTKVERGEVLGALAHNGTRSVVDAEGGVSFTSEHEKLPVHSVTITPALRDAVLGGQPMFLKRRKGSTGEAPPPKKSGPYELARRAIAAIPNNEFALSLRRIADPANINEASKATALVTREALGELAQNSEEALRNLEQYSKLFDVLGTEDRYAFIDAMEGGESQADTRLQPAADAIRKLLDDWRERIRGLGTGALDNFIENYFPHIWQNDAKAKKLFGQIFGRRPLKGPASFLKQRTIPTTREGLEAGLKPISTNPLILAFAKLREMQRFHTGVKLMQRFKEEGLARFLPSGKLRPDDWAEINDAVGRVRQWSEAEQGFIERGHYIMPIDAARVINNHLSASALRNFLPAQIFRSLSNAANALQLGFSAFHLGFTTLDAMISKNALGIERLLHGEPLKAAASFLEGGTPIGAALNIRRGRQLLKAYTNPTGSTPQLERIVQGLMASGGRVKMDNYFQAAQGLSPFKGVGFAGLASDIRAAMTKPSGKVAELVKVIGGFPQQYATRLWRDLEAMAHDLPVPVLQMPLEIAGRMTRASTSIIMEHIVPWQKLGVFSDLAADHIRRNPLEDPVAFAGAMQKIWNSVDNRLGEMVYDNVFWQRTFKDVNHMMVRAVGWNLGTIRELGGAPVDVLKTLDYLARGAPPEIPGEPLGKTREARAAYERAKGAFQRIAEKVGHKIPYTLALIGSTMVLGAILTRLFTGKSPEETKDYFFPWTGRLTKYGTKERISMPSYTKDLYEYGTQPATTVINKANPIFGIAHAIYANEDFFGNAIRDPDAGFWKQLLEGAAYAGRQVMPFSVQGTKQFVGAGAMDATGKTLSTLPYVGFGPAPARVTSPEQMDRYQRRETEKSYIRGIQRKVRAAQEKGDTAEVKSLQEELKQRKLTERATERDIRSDKIKAREAAKKISSLVEGRSREQAVAALKEAGMPAMAQLWDSLPERPRPRVATSLESFA